MHLNIFNLLSLKLYFQKFYEIFILCIYEKLTCA